MVILIVTSCVVKAKVTLIDRFSFIVVITRVSFIRDYS